MKKLIFITTISILSLSSCMERAVIIDGCTDPAAINYNFNATQASSKDPELVVQVTPTSPISSFSSSTTDDI